jgi:L-threonylcarbamoyladenylate synthase
MFNQSAIRRDVRKRVSTKTITLNNMRILSDENITEAIKIIRSGGVVAHATETCYGLACDFNNESAVKKVFELKNRPEGMPVSALFPSIESVKELVEWNEIADRLVKKYLPGPLTIVLPLKSSEGTMGVRISSHPVAQKLAELAGVPISTTSANIHGAPNPYSVDDILNQGLKPDLILDSGVLPVAEPSTVLSIENGEIRVLRQGSVKI